MPIEDWKSQLKRGTLEYAILLLIRQKTRYGYELISLLERRPMLAARENTIYPLLRRLLKEGMIAASWQPGDEGLPPRKYYTLTEQGQAYLSAMSGAWIELVSAMAELQEENQEENEPWTRN